MSLSPTLAAACDDAGRQLAPDLDLMSAVLVAGRDVDAAAQVALGAAAAASGKRRVAVADLGGDAAPLIQLVHDEDLHGLADVFDFGISVNRVARQVDDGGRLFVIPGGNDPGLRSEVLDDQRWSRLSGDFRDAGALLLVVAPSDTPGLERLAFALDGVVAADDAVPTLALPRQVARAHVEEVEAAAFRAALDRAGAADRDVAIVPAQEPEIAAPEARQWRVPPALATGLSVAVIGLMVVLGLSVGSMSRGDPLFTRGDNLRAGSVDRSVSAGSQRDVAAATASALPGGFASSPAASAPAAAPPAGAPSSGASAATAATAAAPLPVSNPRDTLDAASYAVVLGSYAEESAAQRHFRDRPRWAAAVTIVHGRDASGDVRYHVISGADRRASVAEALHASMRGRGALRSSDAALLQVPYAVQVESGVPIGANLDSLVRVLNRFLARGFPAYALEESPGRANVYVGAFTEPGDARALITRLQAAGLPAALVVRKGRAL